VAKNEIELDDIDDNDPEAPSQLRAYAKRQGEKAVRVNALEKELAAVKLGIDTNSRKGQAWLAGFTGDITDSEAVLADATDFDPSIIKVAAPAPAPTPAEGNAPTGEPGANVSIEPTGSSERSNLADGAVPSGAAIGDPMAESMEHARKRIGEGTTVEQATSEMIALRARALAEGRMQPLNRDGTRPR